MIVGDDASSFNFRRFSSHLKIEIVGLPNIGKSTLFNTLTKLSIPAENFPFCTIKPNEAVIPNERFEWLCQHFKTKSEVYNGGSR
uniref:G domain-containing protein n=1 Tax=Lactuca sativa TaxID=4236 RepID=A0A9R1UW43_LACSA|nr:hypothetical protein LSAT_V11C800451540 [Lactuca sativa]